MRHKKQTVLFSAAIENFQIVPCVRMTGKSKWIKRAKRYLENKEALAWEFKQKYNRRGPITEPCIISWVVHLPHCRRIDSDNIDKAIRDALQYAGIIENDYLIRGTDRTHLWQRTRGPARVVVSLYRGGGK